MIHSRSKAKAIVNGADRNPFLEVELERMLAEFTVNDLNRNPRIRDLVTNAKSLIAEQQAINSGIGLDEVVSAKIESMIEPLLHRLFGRLSAALEEQYKKRLSRQLREVKKEVRLMRNSLLMANLNPFLWLEGEIQRQAVEIIMRSPGKSCSLSDIVLGLTQAGVSLPGSTEMDRYMAITVLLRRETQLEEQSGFYFSVKEKLGT